MGSNLEHKLRERAPDRRRDEIWLGKAGLVRWLQRLLPGLVTRILRAG